MATGMNLTRLTAPFDADDVEWRIARSGFKQNGEPWAQCLAYLTNRAIQNRLDEVAGPANWKNEYAPGPCGGVLCGLSIRVDGEWVTKWDGAENTDFEAVKGGLSDAMKRAAVQWGIGRYLYELPEGWAEAKNERFAGARYATAVRKGSNEKLPFFWKPPALPEWALPASEEATKSKAGTNGHPVESRKPLRGRNGQSPAGTGKTANPAKRSPKRTAAAAAPDAEPARNGTATAAQGRAATGQTADDSPEPQGNVDFRELVRERLRRDAGCRTAAQADAAITAATGGRIGHVTELEDREVARRAYEALEQFRDRHGDLKELLAAA